MTLFTSVTDKSKRRFCVSSVVYLSVTVFCIVFNAIYTYFSYGMVSNHMKYMFLFPLLLGCMPSVLLFFTKAHKYVARITFNMWNAGCATFITGCTVVGIITNSGRSTDVFPIYCIIGAVMMILSLLFLKKKA